MVDPVRRQHLERGTDFPAHATSQEPGLAVLDRALYCVHRGMGNDQSLWWTRTTDGHNWSRDEQLASHISGPGVGVAAYRDKYASKSGLMAVFRGRQGD
ncbi:hypothetical protein AB0C13_32880 [Streptomyces sp. NPDC049099]|uniref:hypothetical protein n=1 Tax=Streptomyces sp. NPDC049099 TaxID=3155768 RepID=UPI0034356ED8